VTDFGIARSLEADGLTQTGRVLGTTDYVSPEQAMGRGVDARTDIYSLGVLLYEMLTGEVPFTADSVVGVAMKHVNEDMPDVQKRRPEVSSALAAVIERATAKDPKQRYPDMASCLADLETALEVEVARSGGAHGQATSVLETVPKRKILTTRRVSAAGVFVVLAATVTALLITALTGKHSGSGSVAAPAGAPVHVVDAESFDPSPGDLEEHDDELNLAIDGNPGTGWTTESYEAPTTEAAVGKPGVGLIVVTSEPVAARTMRIRSEVSGWDMQVYGSETGPPDTLQEWGKPIGSAQITSPDQTVELTPRTAKYYLIWITKLASTGDGYSVQINEVGLKS
jgi:serine/threonine-protein kinase